MSCVKVYLNYMKYFYYYYFFCVTLKIHVCLMQCIFSSNAFPFFDKKMGKIWMFSSNVNSTSFAKLLLNFPKILISRK